MSIPSNYIDSAQAAINTYLRPDRQHVFKDRATRFATQAKHHSLEGWLRFLGKLSEAQHHALQTLPPPAQPDAPRLHSAHQHHMPPFNAAFYQRPTTWYSIVHELAQTLSDEAPAAGKTVLQQLLRLKESQLDHLATVLLSGTPKLEEMPYLPFIGAALQVLFTRISSDLDLNNLHALDAASLCPCCGSPPVISMVRLDTEINNLRYLHCSLCNLEWNLPRALCTVCHTDNAIALYELEGITDKATTAVRAETCDACQSYLKIAYQEKDHLVDPIADDLATLALDILIDEAGYQRNGFNMLLIGAHH